MILLPEHTRVATRGSPAPAAGVRLWFWELPAGREQASRAERWLVLLGFRTTQPGGYCEPIPQMRTQDREGGATHPSSREWKVWSTKIPLVPLELAVASSLLCGSGKVT